MARTTTSNRLVTRDMGKSGSFNGTSTYCTVPITPSLTAFSVAFWVKLGNGNANNNRIVDWQDAGPLNGFTFNLGLTGSRFTFAPVFSDGSGNVGSFNIYTAVPGDWSHHVLTYEPNNMKWYVNGTLFGTDTSGTMTAAATTLTIGRRAPSAANFFKGLIDGFVFLNGRAMNATEVATLYTSGVHPSDTSCHIRFNDNVNDETANANNLTANNITYSTDVVLKTRSAISGPYRKTVENLVANGDFEYAPAFTAATTGSSRWIDGTAAGSTSISQYGWGMIKTGTVSAQFDTAVKKSGTTSLKLSTASTSSYIEADVYSVFGTAKLYLIPALPSTLYTLSFWMKTEYISGDSSQGATVGLPEYNGTGAVVRDNTGVGAVLKTTTDWTYYSYTVTTQSTTRFLNVQPRIFGHTGTATLQMNAWFDDIKLTKTTPDSRTLA